MAQNTKKQDKNNAYRAKLRKARLKATPPRLAILAALDTTKPLSPHDVIDRLGSSIDRATIYRTLKSLKKANIIRQVDFRHNHPHYELTDTKDHHHLICTSCGLCKEIRGCEVEKLAQTISEKEKDFASIKEHSLEFYGICKLCVKKRLA